MLKLACIDQRGIVSKRSRALSLSRTRALSESNEDEFSAGSRNAMVAERDIFQNLVHSHTKASRRLGYVPILTVTVDCRQNPSRWEVRWAWFEKFEVANFGEILVAVGRALCAGGEGRQIKLRWGFFGGWHQSFTPLPVFAASCATTTHGALSAWTWVLPRQSVSQCPQHGSPWQINQDAVIVTRFQVDTLTATGCSVAFSEWIDASPCQSFSSWLPENSRGSPASHVPRHSERR